MQPTDVVLLQSDPEVAQMLTNSLSNSFHSVLVVQSLDDLRHTAAKHRPFAIVVDLETATFGDVESLKRDFTDVRIVCNHRVADEEMWTSSLNVGADDCCRSSDLGGILFAAASAPIGRTMAA